MKLNVAIFMIVGFLQSSEQEARQKKLFLEAIHGNNKYLLAACLSPAAGPNAAVLHSACDLFLSQVSSKSFFKQGKDEIMGAIKALIDHNPDPNNRLFCESAIKSSLLFITALYRYKPLEIVSLLLQMGAKVDFSYDTNEMTLLHRAVANGDWALTKLLLKYKPSMRILYKVLSESIGIWPPPKTPTIHLLIPYIMTKNFSQLRRDKLLYKACSSNELTCAELLLKAGSDPNGKITVDEESVFACACIKAPHAFLKEIEEDAKDAILQLLIDGGADCNQKDRHGNGPLHQAAKNNNQKAVQFLLSSPQKQEELPLLAGLFK